MSSAYRRCGVAGWTRLGLVCAMLGGMLACVPGAEELRDVILELNAAWSLGRSSLDDNAANTRADLNVKFVNNTMYRAVFTFGTYDPLNTDPESPSAFPIKFRQFFIDDDGTHSLLGRSETEVLTFKTAPGNAGDPGGCGRAFSIGGSELADLIEGNELDEAFDGEPLHVEALRPACRAGVAIAEIAFFAENSEVPGADDDACDVIEEMVGWARNVELAQGLDYPCGATIVVTFSEAGVWTDGKKRIVVDVSLPAVVADAGEDVEINGGGSIGLAGVGSYGVTPYRYEWAPEDGLSNANVARPTASPEETTEYTLTVTDAVGNTATDTVTVTVQ